MEKLSKLVTAAEKGPQGDVSRKRERKRRIKSLEKENRHLVSRKENTGAEDSVGGNTGAEESVGDNTGAEARPD
jgi:hypothetical protein